MELSNKIAVLLEEYGNLKWLIKRTFFTKKIDRQD